MWKKIVFPEEYLGACVPAYQPKSAEPENGRRTGRPRGQPGDTADNLASVLLTWQSTFYMEPFLFQRAECKLNFDLYKIVFCFQIHESIPTNEHNRMKPKKFN